MSGSNDSGTAPGLDDLDDRLAAAEKRIRALQRGAADATERADASDARQDATDLRADASDARQDATEARGDEQAGRLEALERHADIDREMILELQADGLVTREQADNLRAALASSRMIGAAVGIIMALYGATETGAFEILKKVSMDHNRQLRLVAEDVVATGSAEGLPPPTGPRPAGHTVALDDHGTG